MQPASPESSMRGSGQQVGRPWVVASLSSGFQTPDSLLGVLVAKRVYQHEDATLQLQM